MKPDELMVNVVSVWGQSIHEKSVLNELGLKGDIAAVAVARPRIRKRKEAVHVSSSSPRRIDELAEHRRLYELKIINELPVREAFEERQKKIQHKFKQPLFSFEIFRSDV